MEASFARYRFMSFVTGTTLSILCCFLILHTVDLTEWKHLQIVVTVFGVGHGVVLYPIYMVLCVQMAMKFRLHVGYVAVMLLAGFVPGLAFYMEHRMRLKLYPNGYVRE